MSLLSILALSISVSDIQFLVAFLRHQFVRVISSVSSDNWLFSEWWGSDSSETLGITPSSLCPLASHCPCSVPCYWNCVNAAWEIGSWQGKTLMRVIADYGVVLDPNLGTRLPKVPVVVWVIHQPWFPGQLNKTITSLHVLILSVRWCNVNEDGFPPYYFTTCKF